MNVQPQVNAAAVAALVIPSLAEVTTLATTPSSFAAFKADEGISFVRQYDPKVQAIEGYRHAVIRYRNTDKKAVEKVAQMVTIPQLKLTDDYLLPEKATSILLGVFEDEQDAMIRSMIDNGASTIHWNLLTLDHVLASMTAARVSNRLTKEQIEAWARIAFVEVCNQRADQISQAKNYSADQAAKQRAGTLNAYVELAAKLSAPVPNIGMEAATALKNQMLLAKLSDDLSKVLFAKLEAILNPQIVANGDL
jgi:hypothetical protein